MLFAELASAARKAARWCRIHDTTGMVEKRLKTLMVQADETHAEKREALVGNTNAVPLQQLADLLWPEPESSPPEPTATLPTRKRKRTNRKKGATCSTPLCGGVVRKDGMCRFCIVHTCPDNPIARNYPTKEFEVVRKLREWFPDATWKMNTLVQDGCSRRLPDAHVDMGTHMVIVEVDEAQHAHEESACRNKRTMEIFMDAGGDRPVHFIRFNPDAYVNDGGSRVRGCWGKNAEGLPVVPTAQRVQWEQRLSALRTAVADAMATVPGQEVSVTHLFFDKNCPKDKIPAKKSERMLGAAHETTNGERLHALQSCAKIAFIRDMKRVLLGDERADARPLNKEDVIPHKQMVHFATWCSKHKAEGNQLFGLRDRSEDNQITHRKAADFYNKVMKVSGFSKLQMNKNRKKITVDGQRIDVTPYQVAAPKPQTQAHASGCSTLKPSALAARAAAGAVAQLPIAHGAHGAAEQLVGQPVNARTT